MESIIFNKNNIINTLDKGIESKIYTYNDNGDIVAFKFFNDKIDLKTTKIDVSEDILNNKRKKIEFIHNSTLFDKETKPLKNVYDNDGKYLGYTMSKETLKNESLFYSKSIKIKHLKELLNRLKEYNNNGIYYGDFNERNILADKNTIKLCDLDNIRIKDYDFDIKPIYVKEYEEKCNNEKYIDNYCFNIFTYSYLYKIYIPYALNGLYNELPFRMNTKKNQEIRKKILKLDDSYNNEDYFIDNLRF